MRPGPSLRRSSRPRICSTHWLPLLRKKVSPSTSKVLRTRPGPSPPCPEMTPRSSRCCRRRPGRRSGASGRRRSPTQPGPSPRLPARTTRSSTRSRKQQLHPRCMGSASRTSPTSPGRLSGFAVTTPRSSTRCRRSSSQTPPSSSSSPSPPSPWPSRASAAPSPPRFGRSSASPFDRAGCRVLAARRWRTCRGLSPRRATPMLVSWTP
mmetsp:Transcript_44701/g.143177  ORF Transcript_44701/g.143177 Transcript_44701/m.143177 type:complete len:208 (-) Transcript_44701:354-977(-)